MAWPFLIAFVVLLAGVVTAMWRYAFEPGVTGVMLVVGLWALFNLLIAAASLGVVAERREVRRHPRLDGRAARQGLLRRLRRRCRDRERVCRAGVQFGSPRPRFFESPLLVGKRPRSA